MSGEKIKNMTYEKAMKRLDEIILSLEEANISLDDALKLFEEGTKLSVYCADCITKAEQKITELSEIGAGDLEKNA